jgi:hypothetical protein
MTIEKFIIPDVVKVDNNGKTVEFIYSDVIDTDIFKNIISNPDTPPETRDKIMNRLFQVKYMTFEEMNKLLPKPT